MAHDQCLFISEYNDYLVTTRDLELPNGPRHVIECTGDKLADYIEAHTIYVEKLNTYEVYTCDPVTGATGWDIVHVRSTDRLIKSFPLFDCIITKNDSSAAMQRGEVIDHLSEQDNKGGE